MRRCSIAPIAVLVAAALVPLGCKSATDQVAPESHNEGIVTDNGTLPPVPVEEPSPGGCTELAAFMLNVGIADRAISTRKAQQAVLEPLQQSGKTLSEVVPDLKDSVQTVVSDLLGRLNTQDAGDTPSDAQAARLTIDQHRTDKCVHAADNVGPTTTEG
jgi:hypothetical protein